MKIDNKIYAEKLNDALIKKALGYNVKEIVEEYTTDENNNVKLIKRKVTKKNIPPDLPAVKILLETMDSDLDFENLTDEELIIERDRLLEILKNENIGENDGNETN